MSWIAGLGIAVVAAVGCASLYWAVEKADRNAVEVSIAYDAVNCTREGYPLHATVHNGSNHTVDRVSFRVTARNRGHSNDMADGFVVDLDDIMKPDATKSYCVKQPRFNPYSGSPESPETLIWGADGIWPTFH